jgi:hypothetical protein
MSGVFSIASHSTLQYFPEVVMHEQTGCAHFSDFVVDIAFSPDSRFIANNPRRDSREWGRTILFNMEQFARRWEAIVEAGT